MDWIAAALLRTEPVLARRVMTLAWPAVAEQTLAMMIGLVDFYIVGHLGAASLDGVGLGGQILNLTSAFLSAVGVGSTALVARHVGADQGEDATRTAQQSLALAVVIGLAMALVAFFFTRPIIGWFGGEPDVIEQGTRYLRTIAPSLRDSALRRTPRIWWPGVWHSFRSCQAGGSRWRPRLSWAKNWVHGKHTALRKAAMWLFVVRCWSWRRWAW
jgi:hypothetical protein